MGLSAFIHVVEPTKVRVFERERVEGEEKLLDSIVRRVNEIVEDTAAGNVTIERPKHPRKKRLVVTNASGSSHPPKKLRGDHRTSSGAATGECEDGNLTASITGHNLCAIDPSERFVISSDSSHHYSINAFGAEVDSIIMSVVLPLVMTKVVVTSHAVNAPSILVPEMGTKITPPVHAFMFYDSDSTETVRADAAGPSYSAKQEFVDHLAPPALFSHICEMDYHHLFTKFNVGTVRQACLNAEDFVAEAAEKVHADEMDALKQKNVALENERDSLNEKIIELQSLVSAKDRELKDFNVVVSSFKSQNDGLVEQVYALETTCSSLRDQVSRYKRLKEKIDEFQDTQKNIVNDKAAKLDANLLEMAIHLEEKFYPYLITTISGWRWLLTYALKLDVVKYLNSPEYLTILGSAISRAIKKGMQSGLSSGIDHGKAGRSLEDVVAYNLDAEADFNFAMQRLREVDFPLLAKLSSHKDASTADIINLLRLEGPLAYASGMSDLSPDVEHLTLLIHRPKDQVVLGETSLSFALSATSTSSNVPATIVTTTALSTTFASTSFVPPITIDDYEIEELDTTPERDPPSLSSLIIVLLVFLLLLPYIAAVQIDFQALSFYTISTFVILSVGMPISARITASICQQYPVRKALATTYLVPACMLQDPSIIHVSISSSTTANTSNSFIDFSLSSSTNTYLLRCAKLVDVILLSASDLLFLLLGTCLIENILKLLVSVSTFSRYRIMSASFAMYVPLTCLVVGCLEPESQSIGSYDPDPDLSKTKMIRFRIPILKTMVLGVLLRPPWECLENPLLDVRL
nr:hypothetical protein [Tanacetum cinerariifolium]